MEKDPEKTLTLIPDPMAPKHPLDLQYELWRAVNEISATVQEVAALIEGMADSLERLQKEILAIVK